MKIKRKGDIWQIGAKYEKWYYKLPFEFGSLEEALSFTEQYGLKESYDFDDILEAIFSKAVTEVAKRLKLYDYKLEQESWTNHQSEKDYRRDEFQINDDYQSDMLVFEGTPYQHRMEVIHHISLYFYGEYLNIYIKSYFPNEEGDYNDDYPFGEGTFNVENCTWDMWRN